jgi:DNA-binding NtrC family response regulator
VLAGHFAAKAAEKHGRAIPELSAALLEALLDYEWPGNVRELENLMERLVLLDRGSTLGVEFLPEKMLRNLPATNVADESTFEGATSAFKRQLIMNALEAEGGNKVAAAKRLGISRSYLHRLINEFDL